MSNQDVPTKLADLIPEIYYDLIARVPAGLCFVLAVLVIGGVFSSEGVFDFDKINGMNWSAITILIILLFGSGYLHLGSDLKIELTEE